jgi:hypothetical protein
MSKAQEFVDFLNKRLADVGCNERQVPGNRISFSLMQGSKFARIVVTHTASDSRNSYAFVDSDGNIYKTAGWKAPSKGVRATVEQVVGGEHPFFQDGKGFDNGAYSTGWLYA